MLPIIISVCDPPLEIADRIYINLSEAYSFNFERLIHLLHQLGIKGAASSPEKEMIPLRFINGLYLDEVALTNRLNILLLHDIISPEQLITDKQYIIFKDKKYLNMRKSVQNFLDNIHIHPSYSINVENSVRRGYERIQKLESCLVQGINLMINRVIARKSNPGFMAKACHRFALYIRQMIYSELEILSLDSDELPSYFDKSMGSGLITLMDKKIVIDKQPDQRVMNYY